MQTFPLRTSYTACGEFTADLRATTVESLRLRIMDFLVQGYWRHCLTVGTAQRGVYVPLATKLLDVPRSWFIPSMSPHLLPSVVRLPWNGIESGDATRPPGPPEQARLADVRRPIQMMQGLQHLEYRVLCDSVPYYLCSTCYSSE